MIIWRTQAWVMAEKGFEPYPRDPIIENQLENQMANEAEAII